MKTLRLISLMGVFLLAFGGAYAQSAANLPAGRIGEPYAAFMEMPGQDSSELVYSVVKGVLPEGLCLYSTGRISGIPVGPDSTYELTIRVTDTLGFADEKIYNLVIAPALICPEITQNAIAVSAGSVGENVRISLNIKDLGTYKVLALSDGSLPKGMQLNSGILTGIPQESGQFRITVSVKDAKSCSAEAMLDLNVDLPKKLCAKAVSMYPNPAKGDVNLSIAASTAAPIRVQIFNSNSFRVKDISLPAGTRLTKINLSGISPGQYFVLMSSNGDIAQLLLLVK